MKFKSKGSWKSIPMPHTMFGTGVDSAMCGGIEVLNDYAINQKDTVVKSDKKAVKRKSDVKSDTNAKKKKNTFEEVDIINENAPPIPPQKKSPVVDKEISKKKKKKNKNAKNKPAINLDALNKIGQVKENNPTKEPVPHKKESKKPKKQPVQQVLSAPIGAAVEGLKDSDMAEWREVFVCEDIIRNLQEKGFKSPTPIQKLTLPAAINGRMDIVGAAETGSGKTLAFGIPIVQGILNDKKREAEAGGREDSEPTLEDPPSDAEKIDDVDDEDKEEEETGIKKGGVLRSLILTPTRELAMQIKAHIQVILANIDVSIAVIVGGMSVEKQLRLLKRRPEIVVATPGRLWDLVQEGNPHLSNLSSVRYLAIDETDRMGEKGHFEELQKLLEKLREESEEGVGNSWQTFVMSATLSLVHKAPTYNKGKRPKQLSSKEKLKELMEFVGVGERRKVVDITRKAGTAQTLSESVIHCATEEKDVFLYYFIKSHKGRTIVFCNSIDCVRRLSNLFSLLDVKPLPIHAQLHQKQRLKNLDRFTGSDTGLLIATDVAARGLDIPNIQHVVHYQVPRTSEGYIHRSGRTARASKDGLSVLLIDPTELYLYKKLCVTLTRTTDLPSFPVDEARYSGILARMEVARRLDLLLLHARKRTVDEGWMKKAAEEADLILSDDPDSDTDVGQETAAHKTKTENTRRELTHLLRTPLINSEFSGRYPTMSGCLPAKLFQSGDVSAVETLQNDQTSSQTILKKKNKKPVTGEKKFKGFKKKKNQLKSAKSNSE